MKKTARIGLAILVLLFCFNRAAKADFASAFNAGIKAYPPNAKLGGLGGAWSASPSPDGNNPAALATLRNYRLRGAINSDYSFINFDQGPDINVFIIDGLTVLGKGVLRVDYCNFFSNNEETDMITPLGRLLAKAEGESLQIGYGYPINSKFF